MEKTLGSDQLNTLLDKDIDKITLTLLKLVHDPTPMVEGEVVVPPNPPHFPPVIVEKTLEYLGALFGEVSYFFPGFREWCCLSSL